MKLVVMKVTRDLATGAVTNEVPVDTQTIQPDKKIRVAEVVDTNLIEIEAVFLNRRDKELTIHYSLGGEASDGKYYPNLDYKIYKERWGKAITPAIWDKYNLGNLKTIVIEDLKDWLYEEYSPRFAIRDVWKLNADFKLTTNAGAVTKDYHPSISLAMG